MGDERRAWLSTTLGVDSGLAATRACQGKADGRQHVASDVGIGRRGDRLVVLGVDSLFDFEPCKRRHSATWVGGGKRGTMHNQDGRAYEHSATKTYHWDAGLQRFVASRHQPA
ncbi:MAG: hypothetical protein JWQ65_3091 [Devosia sp.]|nr:hypothetical protein [Devosia sp.]